MKTLIVLIVALLVGCSAAGDETVSALSFSVPDDARQAFELAVDDFDFHAGVRPFAGISGTVIRIVPRPEGKDTCADTTVDFIAAENRTIRADIALYVPVPEGCFDDTSLTLAHEMIHAIRAWSGLGLNAGHLDLDHSAAGVFRTTAGDARFDSSTLVKLCEAVDCDHFEVDK